MDLFRFKNFDKLINKSKTNIGNIMEENEYNKKIIFISKCIFLQNKT